MTYNLNETNLSSLIDRLVWLRGIERVQCKMQVYLPPPKPTGMILWRILQYITGIIKKYLQEQALSFVVKE